MAVTVSQPGPTDDVRPVRRALVSVFDKSGLEDLVRGLASEGVELVSTGGSAALIEGPPMSMFSTTWSCSAPEATVWAKG